jgi:uncharacterized protein
MGILAAKMVRFYQVFISPLTPPSCRYYPTCSEYGRVSYERYGFLKGSYLTAWRILRCNPWSYGGYDPVPPLPGQTQDRPCLYITPKHSIRPKKPN